MKQTTDKIVLKTALCVAYVLLIYFIQGAVVVIAGLEGAKATSVQARILFILPASALIYHAIRYRTLSGLGFRRVASGTVQPVLCYIPLLAIAFSNMIGGLAFGGDMDSLVSNVDFLLANLAFTLVIGLSEELFFRGIICNMWLEKSATHAIVISATLFGLCHGMNVLAGAPVCETLLQIFFAYVYGIVMAIIFIKGRSIVPCILLHMLHDFLSFISADIPEMLNFSLMAVQFIILVLYMLWLMHMHRLSY